MTAAGAALADWSLDEPLLAAALAAGEPRLACYAHPDVAVVLGRGGDPAVETRPAVIAADGVPLLRRRGGGCAVVLDPGNVIISLVLPRAGVGEITAAFAEISRDVIAALAACGVPGVVQRGVSDLVWDDRKLGGSCIWRTRGWVYYSTTILVDPRWDLIERYLPHPPREPDYRRGRDHREFLTSLTRAGQVDSPAGWARRLQTALTGA